MILTISNLDYTSSLDAQVPPKITRKLNHPGTATLTLVSDDPAFAVPATGARIKLTRADGVSLFTGYLAALPVAEYLGFGVRGPAYRYAITAQGDEWLLDQKLMPVRAALVSRTAGDILRQLTRDVAGSAFDVSAVDDVEAQPSYAATPQLRWSQHAAQLALLARAAYRVHDGKVVFKAMGTPGQTISEADPLLSPEALKLHSKDSRVNDVTVIGRVEPRAYARDYFLGDGLTSSFSLSSAPFMKRVSTIVQEEFRTPVLDPVHWTITDPASAISVSGGKLQLNGGNNSDGQTVMRFAEQLLLAGSVRMQHGELELNAPSNGIIGGLYSAAISQATCLAGFQLTPSGSATSISAIVNGSVTGTPLTSVAGHRYALTTRIYCSEAFRAGQPFHSSSHPGGSPRGASAISAAVRVVLEVHDIDPANPGSVAAPSTVLFDGLLPGAPGDCIYAPANIVNANCSLDFIFITRGVDAMVRSTIPAQATRTRLVGNVAEGAECSISQSGALRFASPYIPVSNEAIEVTFRTSARALARVQDAASLAALGPRGALHRITRPPVRNAADCENAALAILDDGTQLAWSAEYSTWSDFMPGGAGNDPWPGEYWTITAPSRGADFSAILHGIEIEIFDLSTDRCRYQLVFANDAAANLSFQFATGVLNEQLDPVIPGVTFIAGLPDAAITAIASTTVTIDAGLAPVAGGGIEVRRSDTGWDQQTDRNLIGRFNTQSFTVPRLARVQTYYLRQYDASSPPKYSRYSAGLHINYPF